MAKKGGWLLIGWVVVAGAVTGWVMTQAEQVSAGNALLVGAVAATVVVVVLARPRK